MHLVGINFPKFNEELDRATNVSWNSDSNQDQLSQNREMLLYIVDVLVMTRAFFKVTLQNNAIS